MFCYLSNTTVVFDNIDRQNGMCRVMDPNTAMFLQRCPVILGSSL